MSNSGGQKPGGQRRGAAGRPRERSKSRVTGGDTPEKKPSGAKSASTATQRRSGAIDTWTGGNRILAALPPAERDFLQPHLTTAEFESGHVVYQQHSLIEIVYFPETAVMSLLSRMGNGAVVEVGTIGNEGAAGLSLFLGSDVSVPETLTQIPGTAQCLTASVFRSAVEELPRFREIIGRCTHAFMTQVSQTAACNRLHGIEQRCARWLLLTHDRVGGADSFPLTHQFLSFMLGVRRAGVTESLGVLTRSGLIMSTSGRITVLDRLGLEAACCECYAIVRRHAGEPFGDAIT